LTPNGWCTQRQRRPAGSGTSQTVLPAQILGSLLGRFQRGMQVARVAQLCGGKAIGDKHWNVIDVRDASTAHRLAAESATDHARSAVCATGAHAATGRGRAIRSRRSHPSTDPSPYTYRTTTLARAAARAMARARWHHLFFILLVRRAWSGTMAAPHALKMVAPQRILHVVKDLELVSLWFHSHLSFC
jgi:hypothetical protein